MRRRKSSVKQRMTFFIVTALILVVAVIAAFGLTVNNRTYIKGVQDIRFGIDISGGVSATFRPAGDDINPTSEQLESAKTIIETRLDSKNILDRNVTLDSEHNSIIVEFPWAPDETEFDVSESIKELGSTAELSFWLIELETNDAGLTDFVKVEEQAIVTGKNVVSADAVYYEGDYMISLEFDEQGSALFADATKAHTGEIIGIYMDDLLLSYPTVQQEITDGKAQITGNFTSSEAIELAEKIQAGALPFSLESTNYSSISATLGESALKIMIYAGIIAFAVICLFMLLYYRVPGLVACINLVLQISGQLLIFSTLGLTLTLPGIAGIILSIGMSVDSNIIIAETIKDELRNNKTIKGAVSGGFSRAFSAVMDCNITTGIVAVLLLIFGTGSMLSFGYTLLIGIIMNFCFGIICSKLMLQSLTNFSSLSKPSLYGLKKKKGGAVTND